MTFNWAVSICVLAIGFMKTSGQDTNCDFSQNVQVGQTYYVYSPGYPNNYKPGVSCRWVATCPANYNCRLECSEISLPSSTNCQLDRLLVSKTGDLGLVGADTYCGTGTLGVTSFNQRLSLGLLTSSTSPGGKFMCNLKAVPVQSGNTTCQCGWKMTNRIVGGTETGVNEFPSMCGLADVRIRQIKCGCTILSPTYVLTAAHCLIGHTLATLGVIVGEHDVTVGDSPETQVLKAAKLLMHTLFNENNYDYDIGIVTTQTAIRFSERVGPICLPFKYQSATFAGAALTALGWGTQFPGGPTSNYLQKVQLDCISQATCQSKISSVTPRQLCTFTRGKDACQDDSGGPLLYQEPTTGVLFIAAIISSGQFCASENPGVNTRVTSHLAWITANAPADYCVK